MSKTFSKKWKKTIKILLLKDVWALKIISTQFWIIFWIHSNKFLDKVFAKALFFKTFIVWNFWKIWFWFLLTDPSVQHILICYQAFLWVQKDAEQNFDTYEDPIWAINYNLKKFLKISKPFVLFISDMSLSKDIYVDPSHLLSLV